MSQIDTPPTLAEATQRLQTFLVQNGYPGAIRWIRADDFVVTGRNLYSVRGSRRDETRSASDHYATGVNRGFGIELRAIGMSSSETFAMVWLLIDARDAEYHLMPCGLKLSCPVERALVRIVKNPVKWFLLASRDKGRSRVLFE
ncbi:hypothetical protein [Candidatus Korobacter versatilis]|uniref:hypothetical protein n=1 Tax=Candidatus Korobacter versatilis TaxID=658062 RepID=UPI00031FA2DE|nr:hypothetical protein [Candidatus Koribacter versatilis]